MDIRPAPPEAFEQIQTLLATLDLPQSDLTRAHLEHFLVCRNTEEIVGTVGLELCETAALLRSLAVRPSHRNEGLGARLVDAIEAYARDCEVHHIYVLTTTASDYFDRHGYETIRRDELPNAVRETDEAAQLCPASATCMTKAIG